LVLFGFAWIDFGMLEGLPPNNAAHMMRLVSDERRARAVADLIVESFEPAEAASTVFETDDPLPGGGKAWLMEAYFGSEPDETTLRDLIAVASDEATARARRSSLTSVRRCAALLGGRPSSMGRPKLIQAGPNKTK
jgi:ribosomal protein L11 methyltransferase